LRTIRALRGQASGTRNPRPATSATTCSGRRRTSPKPPLPRDDIAVDLRRLSADVISLKDTVAELAKTVTAEVGEAATGIGGDIASAAKDQANTLLSEFEAVARRNPLGVVIGAFGIGMLIGIMKDRR
jgi:hypothetical protein